MDKKRFILSTIQPMADHTAPYIATLVGVVDERTGRHMGSGLRCVLHGRRALVTAAHVVQEASSYPPGFAVSAGYGKTPFIVSGSIHVDPTADVAVYYFPDTYPTHAGFWSEERVDPTSERLASDYLFLHGFPQARSGFIRLFEGIVSKSLPYGVMQRLDPPLPRLDPFQFAVAFDPTNMRQPDGSPADFIDPRGLSGSPVWRIGASGGSAETWAPELSRLVGVITQWRPDEKLLVASAISRVLELAAR